MGNSTTFSCVTRYHYLLIYIYTTELLPTDNTTSEGGLTVS